MKLVHPSWSASNLAHFPSVWGNVGNNSCQADAGCNNWNPSCSGATLYNPNEGHSFQFLLPQCYEAMNEWV